MFKKHLKNYLLIEHIAYALLFISLTTTVLNVTGSEQRTDKGKEPDQTEQQMLQSLAQQSDCFETHGWRITPDAHGNQELTLKMSILLKETKFVEEISLVFNAVKTIQIIRDNNRARLTVGSIKILEKLFPATTTLYLNRTGLDTMPLHHFSVFKNLRSIFLDDNPNLRERLIVLKGTQFARQLNYISLSVTGIMEPSRAQLEAVFPHATINLTIDLSNPRIRERRAKHRAGRPCRLTYVTLPANLGLSSDTSASLQHVPQETPSKSSSSSSSGSSTQISSEALRSWLLYCRNANQDSAILTLGEDSIAHHAIRHRNLKALEAMLEIEPKLLSSRICLEGLTPLQLIFFIDLPNDLRSQFATSIIRIAIQHNMLTSVLKNADNKTVQDLRIIVEQLIREINIANTLPVNRSAAQSNALDTINFILTNIEENSVVAETGHTAIALLAPLLFHYFRLETRR